MEALQLINFVISILFVLCYTYQFFYIPVPWLKKERPHAAPADNRFAVLICARNEAAVIGDLIASIRSQSYDPSLVSIRQGLRAADTAESSGAGLPRRL